MNSFMAYELAKARQHELLREAEMERLAAEARGPKGKRRELLLARIGDALISLGVYCEQRAYRFHDVAAS